MTSQGQEDGVSLEVQLAELASQSLELRWLLEEYHSTEQHTMAALHYVIQQSARCGYSLPRPVRLETQPTALMKAYAGRDAAGAPVISVNTGLRFFLMMLNYSLVRAAFKNTVLGGRSLYATLFAIINGYWPPRVDLVSEMEALAELSEDERYFVTAWLPSQIFFVVGHEFAQHLIRESRAGPARLHRVRLRTGRSIEVYRPSPEDVLNADDIAFDLWDRLNLTLSGDFQAFMAGGLGALLGDYRILQAYARFDPTASEDFGPPAIERYERLKARLSGTGRVRSLEAMEEAWGLTDTIMESCIEGREMLLRDGFPDISSAAAKVEVPPRQPRLKRHRAR